MVIFSIGKIVNDFWVNYRNAVLENICHKGLRGLQCLRKILRCKSSRGQNCAQLRLEVHKLSLDLSRQSVKQSLAAVLAVNNEVS